MALQYADVTGDLFEIEAISDDAGAEGALPALLLRVHVQPGAGSSAVLGRRGGSLALRVAPPPNDPRATAAAKELIANFLELAEEQVELASGERGADKRFRIVGVDASVLRRQIDEEISRAAKGAGGARGGRGGR
jgi:uncharacterized protein YggU (UPF0235/DUF167 family)